MRQRHYRLHRTLAVSLVADKLGSVMVLESAGDNLSRGSRASIDQHDEVCSIQQIPRRCLHAEASIGRAAVGRDDDAVVEKNVSHGNSRFQYAARIIAQ